MKRSEMEKLIAITLSKQAIVAGVSGLLWVDVKEILTKIEEAGMLPPERVVGYSPFMTANIWEPEND